MLQQRVGDGLCTFQWRQLMLILKHININDGAIFIKSDR